LKLPPMPNILKHHLAVVGVLVSPIDDHGVARDFFANNLFEVDIEDASIRTGDGLKALEDAIEVGWAARATVAHRHDGRSLLAWRSVGTVVVQGRNAVALPAMLPATEARIGIANGAMIATAQVGR
jgi:hypothetical protein